MNSHNDPHADLKELLDEAARWCRPQAPGWDDLPERLPPRSGVRFPNASPVVRQSLLSRRWLPHVVAASLLLAAGVVFLGHRSHTSSVAVMPTSADAEEQPPVVLAEGCVVKPVGEAVFRVIDPRRVQLDRGELYVEIGPGQEGAAPFVVETPAGEAQLVDTSCVVQSRSLEDRPLAESEVDRPTETQGDPLMAKLIPDTKFLTRVLVLAGMVQLVTAEMSLEGHGGEVLAAETPKAVQQTRGAIPGLWALRQNDVRKDLGLTAEQEKKLDAIGTSYREAVTKVSAGYRDLQNIQDVEQRQAKQQQIREATKALSEKVRTEALAVLTAEQLDQLLRYQLTRRSLTTWCSPLYVEAIAITPEQKTALERQLKEIGELGQPWQAKMRQVSKEVRAAREQVAAEIFAKFTPEQLDKIKQDVAKSSFVWSVQRPEIAKQIGLSEEQAEKIKQISKDYSEAVRKVYGEIRNLAAEKRKEAYQKVQAKVSQLSEETKQQVKAVLTAEQIDQLLLNQARATALWKMKRPEFIEKFGIAGKQKEEIQQRIVQVEEKSKALQQEIRDISGEFQKVRQQGVLEALEVLTVEQIEKLKQMELTQTWPRPKAQPQPLKK